MTAPPLRRGREPPWTTPCSICASGKPCGTAMALTPPTSPTSYALPTALVPRRDHPRAPPHRHPRKSLPVLRPRLPLLLRARAPSRPSSFNDQLAVPAVTRARRRARVGGCFGGCTVVRVESLHLRETGASVKAQHRRWRTIHGGGAEGAAAPWNTVAEASLLIGQDAKIESLSKT